jgi:hypothetical protein
MLCDVGEHARIDHARAIGRGINAGVKMQVGACACQPHRVGHSLHGFQPLWQQDPRRLMDGSDRKWRQHRTVVVGQGDDLLALLRLVARRPDAVAPVLATVLVPSPCTTRTARRCSSARGATRAVNACGSDPAAAPWATALETVVAWMAGGPWASFGMGTHVHGIPVERTPQTRVKRPCSPRGHFGARLGLERCGKIPALHSRADHGTGIGVMAGLLAVVLRMSGPHVQKVDSHGSIQISPHTTRGEARLQNSQPVHCVTSLAMQPLPVGPT